MFFAIRQSTVAAVAIVALGSFFASQARAQIVSQSVRPSLVNTVLEESRQRLSGGSMDVRVERRQSAHGFEIIRLRRYISGLPVLFGEATVRTNPLGRVDFEDNNLGANAVVVGRPLNTDAISRVFARDYGQRFEVTSISGTWLHGAGQIRPTVTIFARGRDQAFSSWVFFYTDEAVRPFAFSRVLHARGDVLLQNEIENPSGTTTDVELADVTSATQLLGTHIVASSCGTLDINAGSCSGARYATPNAQGDYRYPPMVSMTDAFSEVNTYYHGARMIRRLVDEHEFAWTCNPGQPLPVLSNIFVNGQSFPNAAFVPPDAGAQSGPCGSVIFGSVIFGRFNLNFAHDPDVVYHELGHAVMQERADMESFVFTTYGTRLDNGAINEGTSDYWAASFQGNANVAETLSALSFGRGEVNGRDVDTNWSCPNDFTGEIHEDGRVWASALHDLQPILGRERSDALVYTTISTFGSSPSYRDATETLLATVDSLTTAGTLTSDEQSQVRNLMASRNLIECEPVIELTSGTPRSSYHGLGSEELDVVPLQYHIRTPPGTRRAVVRITRNEEFGRGNVRSAETFVMVGNERLRASTVTGRLRGDNELTIESGLDGTIDGSQVNLDDADLYLAPAARDESLQSQNASLFYTISVTLLDTALPDAGTDGGVGDGGTGGTTPGNCGCTIGHSSPSAAWFLIAAPLFLLVSRRRR